MDYNISFQERARLGQELLDKQGPVTLEYARAQVLCLKICSSNKNKEEDIKHHLEMYHPNWTKDQIENECSELLVLKHLNFEERVVTIMKRMKNYP